MSSIDVLVTTLIKAFKLEPEVEKAKEIFRQIVKDDLPEQVKAGLAKVDSVDERLARIERKLGINGEAEPSSDPGNIQSGIAIYPSGKTQLRNGTDNG